MSTEALWHNFHLLTGLGGHKGINAYSKVRDSVCGWARGSEPVWFFVVYTKSAT